MRRALAWSGLTLLPAVAAAHVPRGSDFRVNTYTTGAQYEVVMAPNAERPRRQRGAASTSCGWAPSA